MAAATYFDQVQKLFIAFYQRPADSGGLVYWAQRIDAAGGNASAVVNAFATSAEATTLYGAVTPATIGAVVDALYLALFNRAPDAAGKKFYVDGFTAGTFTAGSIALNVLNGAAGDDSVAIANKLQVANSFTAVADGRAVTDVTFGQGSSFAATYAGDADVVAARTMLKGVTYLPTSVLSTSQVTDSIKANIANPTDSILGTVSGQTFTLTSGVDVKDGGIGNDTFIADNTNAAKQLTTADQLNGGAGTDTLKVFLAAGDTATGQPTLTSIENVYINGGAITAYTAATGTTGLSIDSAVVGTTATYTLAGQALTLANFKTTNATTTVASTADTVENITLNGFTATTGNVNTLDLSGTKQATLNLTATGAASKITLTNTGAALTSVTVAGDKGLTVTESVAAIKTINAAASTGGVTFDVSGATQNVAFAFTGGSGADKLTVAAGQLASTALTSGAQIDFGAGVDTLVIKDTTPEYTAINAMKGLEVVQAGVTGTTFNMASLTAAAVSFAGGYATGTVTNLEATDSVTVAGAISGSLTVGGAVGNSTGTINIGAAGAAGFTVASLVTTGLTNINLSSNGDGTVTNVITAMTNSDNTNFTITGSNDLTMAVTSGATVTGDRVNAAAFTGKLSVTGSVLNDIIIGGSGADTIQGAVAGQANQADTLTGGAGADKFVFTAATGAAFFATSAGTAAVAKITDFVAGTDKFDFITTGTAFTSATVANAQTIATAADLTAVYAGITAIAASTATAASTVVITVTAGAAAGTYLYVNDATAGVSNTADMLINITGVSGTITAADFIFA